MTEKKFYILLIIYTFLVLLLTMYATSIINEKNNEIDKLNKEIKDYEWQLDQVPYIIESWCNGE